MKPRVMNIHTQGRRDSRTRPSASGRAKAWRCAAILTVWIAGGCKPQGQSSTNAPQEQTVTVAAPIQRELPRYLRITGTLHGDEEATIAAKVAGRIVEVLKDMGDAAQPGEPLMRIDPTDYELALAERQRAFYESLAKLGLNELPGEGFDVGTLPSVERARLQAANAQARYERSRVLFERDPPLISEQDFADLQTTWEVAQSNLQVERLTAESILAEARTVEAQVKVAEQRVRDCVHRAPEAAKAGSPGNGVSSPRLYEIAARTVTVGDYVQIGSPLMRLVDSDPLKLRASVAERRLGAVKVGQAAIVRVEAFAQPFEGRVGRVSPTVDLITRSFPVEILVSNSDRALKPGSFATAQLEIARQSALLVPESSVLTFAGVHKVVIVVNNQAQERRVDLGEQAGEGLVEIRAGLTMNDQVVLRPPATLTSGMPVKIVSAAEMQAARSDQTSGQTSGVAR
jgi:HlyD family secretion protein